MVMLPHLKTVALSAAALLLVLAGAGGGAAPAGASARTSASMATPVAAALPTVTRRNPGWALDRIDQQRRPLDKRFTTVGQGQGVTVYIVDGLFETSNPEFENRATVGLPSGRNCMLENGIDHGTFVAGIVAGRRTGVAPKAKLVSVGALAGCEGVSPESEAKAVARVVRALDWVAAHAHRPAVVNMSLNFDQLHASLAAAVARVIKAKISVVASAGNDGEDACHHPPSDLPSVTTVSASTRTDRVAGLNWGRCVNLYAPGTDITSVISAAIVPGRIATDEGPATSWAAPFVTGAAALYLARHPQATPKQVRANLFANATSGVLRGNLHGSPDRLLFTGGQP
jgi:subtilisin family serine protease